MCEYVMMDANQTAVPSSTLVLITLFHSVSIYTIFFFFDICCPLYDCIILSPNTIKLNPQRMSILQTDHPSDPHNLFKSLGTIPLHYGK